MALVYDDLLGHHDRVAEAIKRLQAFEPKGETYYGAFSGGKDSQTIYHLAQMAGVNVEWHYSLTTVDPPPLVTFLKQNYPDVIIDKTYWKSDGRGHKAGDPVTMWNLIVDRGMPPTRKARYCCEVLKETKGKGRVTVTGVRWEESANRRRTHGLVDLKGGVNRTVAKADELGAQVKNNGRDSIILNNDNDASRQLVEFCFQKSKTTLNPIIDWSEEDVWEFLNEVAKVPHCVLYDQGWKRLGCIGCPMANVDERRRSFEEWPTYKQAYIRAFQKMIDMKSSHRESVLAGSIAIQDESGDTPAPEPRLPMETSAQQDSSMVLPPPTKIQRPEAMQDRGTTAPQVGELQVTPAAKTPPRKFSVYRFDGEASIYDVWDSNSGISGKQMFDWFSQGGV